MEEVYNKIEIKGVSAEAVSRYSKIIQLLIASGGLDVKKGTTTLIWKDSFLNDIEIKFKPYSRDIPVQYK